MKIFDKCPFIFRVAVTKPGCSFIRAILSVFWLCSTTAFQSAGCILSLSILYPICCNGCSVNQQRMLRWLSTDAPLNVKRVVSTGKVHFQQPFFAQKPLILPQWVSRLPVFPYVFFMNYLDKSLKNLDKERLGPGPLRSTTLLFTENSRTLNAGFALKN